MHQSALHWFSVENSIAGVSLWLLERRILLILGQLNMQGTVCGQSKNVNSHYVTKEDRKFSPVGRVCLVHDIASMLCYRHSETYGSANVNERR